MRIEGQFRALRAALVVSRGGNTVVYLDKDGCEVHREPLSKSQFKGMEIEKEDD